MSSHNDLLTRWHEFITTGNQEILDEILLEEVVFHSPVVWTPQKGKGITKIYLSAAAMLLKSFDYKKQIISKNEACLEFTAQIDDIIINGVDILTFNKDSGKISEFKVMIRPLQAVNKIHEKMQEMLSKLK